LIGGLSVWWLVRQVVRQLNYIAANAWGEEEKVENHEWITQEEFTKILGITELFPGAKSIKFAAYSGYKILGAPGVIIANLGNFLPPALISVLVKKFLSQYRTSKTYQNAFDMIKLSVAMMIFSVALRMVSWKTILHFKPIIVMVGSFVLFHFFDIHPAIVIILSGIIGILLTL
jgi:chromate transporter